MAKSKGRLLAELLASDGKVKESKSALDIAGGKLAASDIPILPNSKLENSSISIAGHSTSLGESVSLNTGDITEHTNYKYYTESRVRSAISATGDIAYNSTTGVISFSQAAGAVISVNGTTGSVVLDTSDVAENGNLYHTTARARAAISATGSLSYNSTTGVISFTMPAQNTSNITEGSNKYYTDARVGSYLSTNGYATQSTIVGAITDSAPATLDTLNELAAALGDDANFSTTVTNSIATKLPLAGGALTGAVTTNSTFDGRNVSVDGTKLDGIAVGATNTAAPHYTSAIAVGAGGLTQQNFTTTLKNKLDGIATSANNYVLPFTNNSANWNTAYGWGNHASQSYATQSYVGTQISNLVDSSPATLNTLNELAAALGDDPNFATTVSASIGTKLPLVGGTLTGNLLLDTANAEINLKSGVGTTSGAINWTFNTTGTDFASIKLPYATRASIGLHIDSGYPLTLDGTTSVLFAISGNNKATINNSGLTVVNTITASGGNSTNWNTAYGWGNHASAGYVTSSGNTVIGTDTDLSFSGANVLSTIALTDGVITAYTNRVLTLANLGYTGETNATADQSAAEILTAIKTVDGSGSGLDADTLDGYQKADLNPAHSHYRWTNISASGTQARRFVIMRLYACPAHWDGGWQDIHLKVWSESYEATNLKYEICGDYAGAGTQASMFKLRLKDAGGSSEHGRFRLVLGTPVDAGWDYSGADTYYVDVYAEASHYMNFTVAADFYSAGFNVNTLPTSGGATTVVYSSPTVSNITTFNEAKEHSYFANHKIWNDGNHGSASGLDADLLDGQHGSYYAPLSSPTFTGKVSAGTGVGGGFRSATYTAGQNAVWSFGNAEAYGISYKQGAPDDMRIHFGNYAAPQHLFSSSGAYTSTGEHYVGSNVVWNAGNDGAGSGLDADLLDGVTSASFLRSDVADTAYGKINFQHNDGIRVSTNGSNPDATTATYEQGITIAGGNMRLNIDVSSTSNGGSYLQTRHNSSTYPNAYYTLKLNPSGGGVTINGNTTWHAGNDGSGSTLDADLLDGQHGSYYRAYANLTGTPTIPSLSGYATESYVGTQISNLVDSSPAALNTLNELAAALGDNASFATDVTTSIGLKAPLANPAFTGNPTAPNIRASSGAFYINRSSDGTQAIRVDADGVVIIPTNYFYVSASQGSYFSSAVRFRGTISNDTGTNVTFGQPISVSGAITSTGVITSAQDFKATGNNMKLHAGGNHIINIDLNGKIYPQTHNAVDLGFSNTTAFRNLYLSGTANSTSGNYTTTSAAHTFTTAHGNIQLGPMNGSWAHIYTNIANGFYFNKEMRVNNNLVWNAGNDGAGSGLDADLLDGQHASAFLTTSGTAANSQLLDSLDSTKFTYYRGIVSGDWDTIFTTASNQLGTSGLYQVQNLASGHSNHPTGVYTYGGVFAWQLANSTFKLYSSHLGDLSFQSGWGNDEYSGWRRILTSSYYGDAWTSSNDGAGSTLDADLLDGQQGSHYLAWANVTGKPTIPTNNNQLTNGSGYQTTSGTVAQSNYVSGSAFATTGSPGSVLEYQQASGQTDTRLAPSGDWHNTIRMGHGNPYNYYSNTIAARMTGTGVGDLYTQSIHSNTAQGWRKLWSTGNDGAGSTLDADLLDGQHGSYYYAASNPNGYTNDQTAAEILTAIKTVDGSGSGLDADLLDGRHLQQIARYQSGSDFANGTLVTTSIASSGTNGDSFVIEITGKAYGSSKPHSVIAEGYLYNNSIIATSGTNISGNNNFTYLKAMSNGGYLSFWWPRHAYWNSYDVHVRSSSTGTSNYNKVTAITNSVDPSGATKKIQINLAKTWNSDNDGAGSALDADLLDGQHGSYYAPASHNHSGVYLPISGKAADSELLDGIDSASFLRSDANDTATGDISFNGQLYFNSDSTSNYTEGARFNQSTSGWGGMAIGGIRNSINGISQGWWFARNPSGQLVMAYQTSGNAAGLMLPTSGYNLQFRSQNVWNAGNDGSGSTLDADLLDGQHGSYYAPNSSLGNYVLKGGNTGLGGAFKMSFFSGGGGATFGANHYSMGVDVANGSWSSPNYSDLIIGYHTGIRIGAAYGGTKFYNNSPTTDTNNNGEGDGTEALLMTVGGVNGGNTHVVVNNDLIAGAIRSDNFQENSGTFLFKTGSGTGRTRHLNLANTTNDPAGVTDAQNPTGISWGQRSDNTAYYMLGLKGSYNNGYSTHSRLTLAWHTGIEIGASPSYGGTRFMADSPFFNTTEIMSVGKGDSHVRVTNNLYANGGNLVFNASNDGSGSGLVADYATKVTFNTQGNTNTTLKLLLGDPTNSTIAAGTVYKDNELSYNTSSNTLYAAVFSGNVTGNVTGNVSGSSGSCTGSAGSVGGISTNSIVYGSSARKSTQVSTFAGVNEVSGFYFGQNASGSPTTDWMNYLHIAGNSWSSSNNYSFQLTHAFHSDNLWVSRTTNGSQSTARKIWDSASDGSGSTLDADLLDGQEGSYYYAASNPSGYTTNTGTLTAETVSSTNTVTITGAKYYNGNRNTTSNSPPLQVYGTTSGAIMSFHRGGYYAVNMGLDSDNVFRIGGWSAATNRFVMDMSGNLTMAGNITAYSDSRLKENVEVIENALSKVQAMRGVTFTRNDVENKEERHAGVIAQEVEVVFPEVVSENNEGIKNVAYGNMVGLLIEAIKELKEEVNELKRQVKEK